MGTNIERLGNTLSGRMKRTSAAAVPTVLELGTINKNLSLSVDSLPEPIPQNEYMVSLQLTHDTYYTYNELNSSANAPHVHVGGTHSQYSGSGYHEHTTDGLHDHRLPAVFRGLKAGDRVLVAWVGNEPIVISIVVSGTTVNKN